MRVMNYFMAAAAASMAVAPVMAAPTNPASSQSVAKSARVGSTTKGDQLRGRKGGGGYVVAVVAAVAVIIGIVIVVSNNNDRPNSP